MSSFNARQLFGEAAEQRVMSWLNSKPDYMVTKVNDEFADVINGDRKVEAAINGSYGDLKVVSTKSGEPKEFYIDVKRSEKDGMFGTITPNSEFISRDNSWYFVMNKSMTEGHWIKASKLQGKTPKDGKYFKTNELKEYWES